MEQNKKCPNIRITELLPWYHSNTLSQAESAEVKKHLEICGYCREQLENIQWINQGIKGLYKEAPSIHLTPEKLTLFAEAKAELPESELIQIKSHLDNCNACKKELDTLLKVNQTLEREKLNPVHSIFLKIRESVEAIIFRPVFAYILVLLLIYPAWTGLFKHEKQLEEMAKPVIIKNNYALDNIHQRSHVGTFGIRINKSDALFMLSFSIPISEKDNSNYSAYINNSTGKTIWQEKHLEFTDSYGSVIIVCHSGYFTEGNYTLYVNDVDGNTKNEYKFVFDVVLNE